jgi:hypothetical protein
LYKNNQLINLSNQITTTTNFKMSATNNNNNNNNKKPFCKVCADAGKTDTAHYVRLTPDPKSPVVCPTLLALECRYCFKSGHTVKYCALAKKNNKLRINKMPTTTTTTTNNTTQDKPPTYNNKFAALLEQEEDDNTPTTSITTSITTSMEPQHNNNNSWASIAKTKTTPTPKTKTTPVDNYQYHCWAEDFSRSPNLEAWLVEPSVQQQEQQEQQEQLTVGDKYGDRLYDILYEYYRERAGKIVGMLLECSEEELAYCMSNRLYLEERANEAFELLQQDDVPAKGYLHLTEVEDW